MYGKTNSVVIKSDSQNTLKKLLDATKSTKYLFNNYTGDNITNLIKYNDTSEVTNMSYMYNYCKASIFPILNMSKVTDASYMYYQCSNLTEAPNMDLSNVGNCFSMFRENRRLVTCNISDFSNAHDLGGLFNGCSSLTNLPSQLITPKLTDTSYMYAECSSLISVPQMDTSNVTTMNSMFYKCSSLTTIPLYNTSKVTSMSQMFWNCSSLQTVPAFDCSNVTNMNNIFDSCSSLKSVLMTNIGVNLDISASTLFERADLVTILNNLKTVTTTKTLKMGATNLAKLTDEDKAIATNKGWTLA